MRAIALAACALLLATLTCSVAGLLWISSDQVVSADETAPRIGSGYIDGKALHLNTDKKQQRLVASAMVNIDAETRPVLDIQIASGPSTDREGQIPRMQAFFIWRRLGGNGEIEHIALPWPAKAGTRVELDGHPQWRGTISEVGVDIYSSEPQATLILQKLRFPSAGWSAQVSRLWADWSADLPWSHSSINQLRVSRSGASFTPNLALGLIAFLATLLLLLFNRQQGLRTGSSQLAIVLLLPWIASDLLWQQRLGERLQHAQSQFQGKSLEQRHLADSDSTIYQYARHLNEKVLAAPGEGRVFILHPSEGHVYQRLKLQYYLLPRRIFNDGKYPPDGLTAGDQLIVLGRIPALTFSPGKRELNWPGGRLQAQLLERTERAAVYQILPESRS